MPVNNRWSGNLAALAISLLFSCPAFALDEGEGSYADSASAAAGVPVFSGGVGDDEMEYIKTIQGKYDVKLMFTEANGMYLSDLSVAIKDKHGKTVVNTVTRGPILLVNLPAGTYQVSASSQSGDTSHDDKISVKGHGLHTYQLRFPTRDSSLSENDYK